MSEPNVVTALAAVMRQLPAIGKDGQAAAASGGYKYRGIEQITAVLQKILAENGVVIVPRVKHRMVEQIEVNGKPWTDTYLEVNWSIYGPGGVEDCIEACTFGHGRDNSDKGSNKAMTQAFKYLLLDMLCISDPADDNDGTNQAADARRGGGTSFSAPQSSRVSNPPVANITDLYDEVNGELIPKMEVMQSERTGPQSSAPTPKQVNYAKALLLGAGLDSDDKLYAWFGVNELGAWPGSVRNLTKEQATGVIERLKP